MTVEQIEGNEIIAEFMGAKYLEGRASASINPMYRFDTKPSFHPDHWHTFNFQIDYMLYHSSWDWLMPVVDKCWKKQGKFGEGLGYFQNVTIFKPIEEVYDAVIVFIKWYNENKEEIK